MQLKEINSANFVNRRDDLKRMLDQTKSESSRSLIKSCYYATIYAFYLYTEHMKILIALAESIDLKGKNDIDKLTKQLAEIPIIEYDKSDLFLNVDPQLIEDDLNYLNEVKELNKESRKEFERIGKQSIVNNMILSAKIVVAINDFQSNSLFDQIYVFDLSEFQEYNIHDSLLKVLGTLIGGLDKKIEIVKLIYDLSLNLKTRKTISDFAAKGDMVNRFLETYYHNISAWTTNTKKLMVLNNKMKIQNFN